MRPIEMGCHVYYLLLLTMHAWLLERRCTWTAVISWANISHDCSGWAYMCAGTIALQAAEQTGFVGPIWCAAAAASVDAAAGNGCSRAVCASSLDLLPGWLLAALLLLSAGWCFWG
jgi:hypothetical protein